jgi:nicotinamide-nucleotide amidase
VKNIFQEFESNLIKIKEILDYKKYTLSTAESCTGGLLAGIFTSIAGSSSFFVSSIIAYSNYQKKNLLKINEDILKNFGAVSEQCANEMAKNIKELTGSNIAISTTGIAGPGGGTDGKPVGTVFSTIILNDKLFSYKFNFTGERNFIRISTIKKILEILLKILEKE